MGSAGVRLSVLALAVLVLLASCGGKSSSYFVSATTPDRPTHTGTQGDGWSLVFQNNADTSVTYQACAHLLGGTGALGCWFATVRPKSSSRIRIARFVNDSPGDWIATWKIGDREVASWRFTVRSEGV